MEDLNITYNVGKLKVFDVLAIYIGTEPVSVPNLEDILQYSGEQFRRNNDSLSHTLLTKHSFCGLIL